MNLSVQEELLRKALFVPCSSMEDLHRWIKVYLGLDMPWCTVDPASNSSPMQSIWEIYSAIKDGKTHDFSQVLTYAARDAGKTLSASIMEILCAVHFEWSVAHMAAILPQSKNAQKYVKTFLNRPILRECVTSENERAIEFTKYVHIQTKEAITPVAWEKLTTEKDYYFKITIPINIVVCTVQGANGLHRNLMVIDETDIVTNPDAYEEAKMIPTHKDGTPPLTLYTSTRKYSFGLVQKEIDNAHETGLVIRHYNIIDVTEACPPSRHLPDEPKIPIYWSKESLKAIPQEEYAALPDSSKDKYEKDEGYTGCLKNCKLFAACRGRLATEQKSKSPMLKPISQVTAHFRKVSPEKAKAQLLCWKPSKEGLIFTTLDSEQHLISAAEMAKRITGADYPETFSRSQLIELFRSRDTRFVVGMDFGYTHNFAVVLMAVDGNRGFVIGHWAQPELDPAQKLELCNQTIKEFDPILFADPEAPDMVKFLKKHGYRCRQWTKGKGSVLGGIETIRVKLNPGLGQPELFFLKNDDGVMELFRDLGRYHWALDPSGKPSDVPDDADDDSVDALRYAVMNVFKPKGKLAIAKGFTSEQNSNVFSPENQKAVRESWGRQVMNHALNGNTNDFSENSGELPVEKGRKGGFAWEI